jgi:predicted DNA-binding WGR domain protein
MNAASHGNASQLHVVLDRIRPAKNERRFYALSIAIDLFGNTLLFRNWGRIGTAGRVRFDVCYGQAEAIEALHNLARLKRRRGYRDRNLRPGMTSEGSLPSIYCGKMNDWDRPHLKIAMKNIRL